MYVRITPTRITDLAREAEITRLAEEQLIPALRQVPGFQHYFATINRTGTGPSYTITVWETQAQADGLRDALGNVIGQFQALGVELEASQVQEVLTYA